MTSNSGNTTPVESSTSPLTRLVYVMASAIVVTQSFATYFVAQLKQPVPTEAAHFYNWELLVKYAYPLELLVYAIVTLFIILAYKPIEEVLQGYEHLTSGRRGWGWKMSAGLLSGIAVAIITFPVSSRGDVGAKLIAQYISHAIFLSPFEIIVLLSLLTIVPLTGEMVFRGIVFRTLLGYVSLPAAIIVSSLLFANLWPVLSPIAAVILSIVSCVLYYRMNSLLPSIIASAVAPICSGSLLLWRALSASR